MPVNIPDNLPAAVTLANENIFVMTRQRAETQDIRPLRIAILNLMPTKIQTETQLLRLIGNSALQVDITLMHMGSHVSKNTAETHLEEFYTAFQDTKKKKFDGMIITGAPVEQMPYEEVDYWEELSEVMDIVRENVTSTMFICWGAQAALYHYYGVGKKPLSEKCFGVFSHKVNDSKSKLMRGFDDVFYAPHSRHTTIDRSDIAKFGLLSILAESDESGVYIIEEKGGKAVFVMGHSEYDGETLKNEYERDLAKGLPIKMPSNYFINDDPSQGIAVRWRAHSNLLFTNWLNYYVYQETPYVWE